MLILLSILPVAILLIIIYCNDKFEKEPVGMLTKAFLGGALSVFPITMVELLLEKAMPSNYFAAGAYDAFVVAAFSEEFFKFLILYILVWRSKYFNEYFDGIVYSVFVSLGFACVENIMYVVPNGFTVAVSRSVLAVPAHFFFGTVMGYYFSMAKFFPRKRTSFIVKSLVFAIILHGLYDVLLMWNDGLTEGLSALLSLIFGIFVVIMWIVGINHVSRLKRMPPVFGNCEISEGVGNVELSGVSQNAGTAENIENPKVEKKSQYSMLKWFGLAIYLIYQILSFIGK